jgi:hypothetical protein
MMANPAARIVALSGTGMPDFADEAVAGGNATRAPRPSAGGVPQGAIGGASPRSAA